MFLSLYNSMSCLRVSNADDKSSSSNCMGCPLSSELYKLSNRESGFSTMEFTERVLSDLATCFQLSSVRVEYKPFFQELYLVKVFRYRSVN